MSSGISRIPGFAWSPTLYEHEGKIKVTVLNTETKQTGETVMPFRITPRISGNKPLASPTAHPLVALLSFPACVAGGQYRIAFQRKGETTVRRTGVNSCRAYHHE